MKKLLLAIVLFMSVLVLTGCMGYPKFLETAILDDMQQTYLNDVYNAENYEYSDIYGKAPIILLEDEYITVIFASEHILGYVDIKYSITDDILSLTEINISYVDIELERYADVSYEGEHVLDKSLAALVRDLEDITASDIFSLLVELEVF